MNCKNCNRQAEGKFCSNCGQSTKVDKINLPNFLSEISDSIFQINKGFFFTLKELYVRPGHSIREYINGKRKNHFKPIAYVFVMSTIYFIITQFVDIGTVMNDAMEGWLSGAGGADISPNEMAIANWLTKNYAYTVIILLPVSALASYLAFFGSGFNYLEHFVLNAYITGQQAIFYSLYAIFATLTNHEDIVSLVIIVISVSYTFFVFWQFFEKQSRLAVFIRGILTYLLSLVFVIVVLGLLLVAVTQIT